MKKSLLALAVVAAATSANAATVYDKDGTSCLTSLIIRFGASF